jgi:hypothetical protein
MQRDVHGMAHAHRSFQLSPPQTEVAAMLGTTEIVLQ